MRHSLVIPVATVHLRHKEHVMGIATPDAQIATIFAGNARTATVALVMRTILHGGRQLGDEFVLLDSLAAIHDPDTGAFLDWVPTDDIRLRVIQVRERIVIAEVETSYPRAGGENIFTIPGVRVGAHVKLWKRQEGEW
jgi:hypothetical protein